jgi:hypothetical protein
MKKIFLIFVAATILITTSCDDFLTIQPVSVVGEETLLTEEGIEWVVTGMYSQLYAGTYSNLSFYVLGDFAGDAHKGSDQSDNLDWNDVETYTFNGTNNIMVSCWNDFYNGIFRANKVLDMVSKMTDKLDADYIAKVEAQAYFFRALWHFQLIKVYGSAVPYVDLEAFRKGVDPQIPNVDENGDYIYIWDKVIADFDAAINGLPDDWTSTGEIGRPNKWAALAYKAKVLMFQASPYYSSNNNAAGKTENWAVVKTILEDIIANGKTSNGLPYELHESYGELFDASTSDNTSENVFEIQQTLVGSSTSGNTTWSAAGRFCSIPGLGGWGFWQPTQDLAQFYMVDAQGLPYLNNEYRTFDAISKRGDGTKVNTDLTVFMDPRVDFNVGRIGIPFYDWDVPSSYANYVRNVSNGGIFYSKKNSPKHSDWGTLSVNKSPGSTTKNIHAIRYADILLWYAETLLQTGNGSAASLEEARTYVNMVRERASKDYVRTAKMDTESGYDDLRGTMLTVEDGVTSPYVLEFIDDAGNMTVKGDNAACNYRLGLWPASSFATLDDAWKALRAEHRAEFALEGRRWFDLCRWGVVTETVNSYANYEAGFITKFQTAVYPENCISMPIPTNQIITMGSDVLRQSSYWE